MKHVSIWIVLLVIVITLVGGTQVISAQVPVQREGPVEQIMNLILPGGITSPDVAAEVNDGIYLPIILKKPKPPSEQELVERFAPVLKFDGSTKDFPMSADAYFKNMMNVVGESPIIVGGTIHWEAEWKPYREGPGPFPNVTGWGDPQGYTTIQAADIDGDGQAELLGRSSCGMETWRFNATSNAWENIVSCSPAWSDAGGWDLEENYSTIQTADVDGDGQDELLARSSCGMETWRFNASNDTWEIVDSCSPAWSDASAWGDEQYYSTIQTADVDGDGQAELLGRSSCGMETWRFNTSSNTWENIINCSPAWSDAGAWGDAKYYSTIQTADVDGDGQAELLARAWCGMMTWHFNTSSDIWEKIADCSPEWSDLTGWGNDEKYYSTIQTADIDGDGQTELLGRRDCGMETWRFNASSNVWDMIVSCSPAWSNSAGWGDDAKYYSTIQTADIDGDGQAELLGRRDCGMETWRFNVSSDDWDLIVSCDPAWSNAAGWGDDAKYYSTIQTADVNGDGQAELLGRNKLGMGGYKFFEVGAWQVLNPPPRVNNCGRDSCRYGMSNRDYQTLTNGEMPTYYRVIYNAEGRARITYWWFYGWQEECNGEFYEGNDGAHHGDWEHIMVTTSPDRSQIDAVTYYFHSSSYTRHQGSFAVVGERPVVYVGKTAHGSYHNQDCSGWMFGTPSHCCEFADYRESIKTPWWDTHLNLVNLDENSESWMLADRKGSQYIFNDQSYTITDWVWGPTHAYCNIWVFWDCWDWEHRTAVSTHPTITTLDWNIKSCTNDGCGTSDCRGLVYDCETYHNQGWPWPSLSSSLPNLVENSESCSEP